MTPQLSAEVSTRRLPDSRLRRVLDNLLDAAVISFALWTLIYCVGLVTQWSLWPSGWLWAMVTVALVVWSVRRAWRPSVESDGSEPDEARAVPATDATPAWVRALPVVGVGLTALAAVGGLIWSESTFRMTWLALVCGIAAVFAWSFLTRSSGDEVTATPRSLVPGRVGPRQPILEDLGVLALAAVTAVLALCIHLTDSDDPYYVNRSVWVAEHGNAATRDTMFGPESFNSLYGGGVPISSIEALFGVLAHMTGVLAGTVVYFVVPPAAAVLAVWGMWRLVRRWAPRRQFLVLFGAWAFLVLSGASMLGNYWIVRIWQGKVIAVAVLMPIIWSYLVDVQESRTPRERWRATALLFAAGIAFFGLTPTAVIWAPLMVAGVLAVAVLLRSWPLAVGAAALAVGPIVSGVAVMVFSNEVGGTDPAAPTAWDSFDLVLGSSTPMIALAIVGLGLSALLVRRGAPAMLAGVSALCAVLVFAPGVLDAVNAVTGSGPIVWRMLYVAPIPVLVGLLLAAGIDRSPKRFPFAPAVVSVAAAACLVVGLAWGGNPIWSHTGHGGPVSITARPQWKVDLDALADVRLLVDRGIEGEVLLPPRRMKVLTVYSTQAFPVVARDWFVQNIQEPASDQWARNMLAAVAGGEGPLPPEPAVDRALGDLHVDLACTGETPQREQVMRLFEAAGYVDIGRIGSLSCAKLQP
ncbi:MAG: hypothetical protein JWO11_3064 [Nocardioides sp.]|nr:hypothetical protein [Nocardioides sp.]